MKKQKNLNKKQLIIVISIIFVLICTVVIMICINRTPYVGKIVNGKAEFIDQVITTSKWSNENIVEYSNDIDLIDNCIITTEIYKKVLNNDKEYQVSLKDYLLKDDISNKEIYNIRKAIELKLVEEDTKYSKYLAITCGFKNEKQLLKYTKAVFELLDKEK